MKHIKTLIDVNTNSIYDFFNKNNVFFDIETTGFSRKYHKVYLIGLVYFDSIKNSWIIHQLFAENLNEEKELLIEFNKIISSFSTIISFNGDNFDIPFLQERSKLHNIDYKIDKDKSFDIYKEVRKYKKTLPLPNLKLKTIEEFLGIYRKDQFSGGDCIDIYYDYLNSKDANLEKFLLRHNFEDLFYLKDVIQILDYIFNKVGFKINNIIFHLNEYEIKNNKLILKINSNNFFPFKIFEENLEIKSYNNYISIITTINKATINNNNILSFIDLNKLNINIDQFENKNNLCLISIDNIFNIENIIILSKSILEKYLQ